MKKKVIFSILILLITLIIIVYYNNNRSITSTKKDLLTHNYEISTDSNFKNLYLVTSDNNHFNFKKYSVKENETLEITIPKNKEFIISLHANLTIAAKWNLGHDSNILKFKKVDWIELNKTKYKDIIHAPTGYSLARQFFYFNSKNKGNEVLTFVYKHNTEDEEYFKFDIKIKVLSK